MTEDEAETSARRLLVLLKEYYAKLLDARKTAKGLRTAEINAMTPPEQAILGTEKQFLQNQANRMSPALQELARQASQMVDRGDVSPPTRVELKLRLAELESALMGIHQAVYW